MVRFFFNSKFFDEKKYFFDAKKIEIFSRSKFLISKFSNVNRKKSRFFLNFFKSELSKIFFLVKKNIPIFFLEYQDRCKNSQGIHFWHLFGYQSTPRRLRGKMCSPPWKSNVYLCEYATVTPRASQERKPREGVKTKVFFMKKYFFKKTFYFPWIDTIPSCLCPKESSNAQIFFLVEQNAGGLFIFAVHGRWIVLVWLLVKA